MCLAISPSSSVVSPAARCCGPCTSCLPTSCAGADGALVMGVFGLDIRVCVRSRSRRPRRTDGFMPPFSGIRRPIDFAILLSRRSVLVRPFAASMPGRIPRAARVIVAATSCSRPSWWPASFVVALFHYVECSKKKRNPLDFFGASRVASSARCRAFSAVGVGARKAFAILCAAVPRAVAGVEVARDRKSSLRTRIR